LLLDRGIFVRAMWMRNLLLLLTMCFCAVAAGAAVHLELVWLGYVGAGSRLARNLPVFMALNLAPLAVYALSALAGSRHFGVLLASCACAGLAAGLWLLAALVPVPDVPDPEEEVGLRGFCVAVPHCVLALVLAIVVVASKPWRADETPGCT
jgi:hypothetical protein